MRGSDAVLKVTIIAVGRLKERYWVDACDEYLKRMRPYADVRVVEVADRDVGRDEARALRDEAADVLKAVPPRAAVSVLAINGVPMSSERFAAFLDERAVQGDGHVCFIIGGAAGLDATVRELDRAGLSFGPATLPHNLARVVLVEQLYRAFRIARNEPYHR